MTQLTQDERIGNSLAIAPITEGRTELAIKDDDGNEHYHDLDELRSRDGILDLNQASMNIDNSNDVIVGPVTQFYAPVTIIQSPNGQVNPTVQNGGGNNVTVEGPTVDSKFSSTESLHIIEIEQEISPIITPRLVKIFLIIMASLTILAVGLSLLLVKFNHQTETPVKKWIYEKEDWGGYIGENKTLPRAKLPSSLVVFQTEKESCYNTTNCFERMLFLKRRNRNDFCNFLVGNDAAIYVFAGWNHYIHLLTYQSGICVSFMGNGNITADMIDVARVLLKEGVVQGKLTENFSVIALNQTSLNFKRMKMDGLYNVIKTWPNFTPKTFYDPDYVQMKFANFVPIKFSYVTTTAKAIEEDYQMFQRSDWQAARSNKSDDDKVLDPATLVVFNGKGNYYCSNFGYCKSLVNNIQLQDVRNGYNDITCNFLIGTDGNIYEGVGWDYYVEKLRGTRIYYVEFLGTRMVTKKMMAAAEGLLEMGVSMNKIARNYSVVAYNQTNLSGPRSNLINVYAAVKGLPNFDSKKYVF